MPKLTIPPWYVQRISLSQPPVYSFFTAYFLGNILQPPNLLLRAWVHFDAGEFKKNSQILQEKN